MRVTCVPVWREWWWWLRMKNNKRMNIPIFPDGDIRIHTCSIICSRSHSLHLIQVGWCKALCSQPPGAVVAVGWREVGRCSALHAEALVRRGRSFSETHTLSDRTGEDSQGSPRLCYTTSWSYHLKDWIDNRWRRQGNLSIANDLDVVCQGTSSCRCKQSPLSKRQEAPMAGVLSSQNSWEQGCFSSLRREGKNGPSSQYPGWNILH